MKEKKRFNNHKYDDDWLDNDDEDEDDKNIYDRGQRQ